MRRLFAVLLVALVALTGCGGGGGGAAKGQQLTIAVTSDAQHFDPHKTFSGNEFVVTNQIYESLLSRKADGSLQGRLATAWQAVEPTVWELSLREGVSFTDGTPFDAEAVKFSLERLQNPETKAPGAYVVGMIDRVEVVDAHKVRIVTTEPFAPLPAHLSHPVAAIVSPKAAAADLGAKPVGTGPFKLADHKKGDSIRLVANENYWGGKPKLEQVTLRVIPESGTQLTELKAGTVDMMFSPQPERFDELVNSADLTATRFLGWGSLVLGMNTQAGPLAEPKVRQAIAYGLDREGMVTTLRAGMAEKAVSLIPPTVFGFADVDDRPFDPAKAKALLAEAGVATPLKLRLDTYESSETKQIAEAMQAQLKEIGIDLEVRVAEFAAYKEATSQPDHGLYLTSWGTVTMDADYALWAFLHSSQHTADNNAFYANADVDQWLEIGRQNADDAARVEAYRKVQEQVVADVPYLPVYHPLASYAKTKRLVGEEYPFAPINLDLRNAELQ